MARTRPGTSPKVFAAFCKNIVAFNGDPPIVGDCAAVEVAEVQGVTGDHANRGCGSSTI